MPFVIPTKTISNLQKNDDNNPTKNKTKIDDNPNLLIENSVGTTFFSSLIVSLGGLQCSRVLHNALLHSNLRWAMEMFDITPLGRIVNRFSKDIDTIDNVLPFNIRVVLSQAFMVKRKQMSKKLDNPNSIY